MLVDLGAYAQIAELSALLAKNHINIPRLRGLRLMSHETPYTPEEIREAMHRDELDTCEDACTSVPAFRPDSCVSRYSKATRRRRQKYLITQQTEGMVFGQPAVFPEVVGFRWDLLHGKNKKDVRFAIKKRQRAHMKELEMWNKYAGQPNVLYVHTRIGGGNWNYYGGPDIVRQPWFLDKVDNAFDNTYCDIYVKIADENYGKEE